MRVIGIDCAVAPENTGVVIATYEGGEVVVERSGAGSEEHPTAELLLASMEETTLLALDAPLGWPEPFGTLLAEHEAGNALPAEPGRFFRRETDNVIAERLGKRPMDVAADRIGRTAFAALSLLAAVREAGWAPVSLAWTPREAKAGVHAIETYPAGRLAALGLPSRGYKRAGERRVRERILSALSEELTIGCDAEPFLRDADQLDALLCVAGAKDFLNDACMAPEKPRMARKEGWIWVRYPL